MSVDAEFAVQGLFLDGALDREVDATVAIWTNHVISACITGRGWATAGAVVIRVRVSASTQY